jgi:hypothetical protein
MRRETLSAALRHVLFSALKLHQARRLSAREEKTSHAFDADR